MRKISLSFLALLIAVMGVLPPAAVFAQTAKRVSISDGYLQVNLNTGNARFAVRTTGGDPLKPSDDNTPVLYEKDIPETSFASFVIDGDNVVFGNRYAASSFIQPLTLEGNRATAVWKYKDIEVTQVIELISADPELPEGNARISYSFRNTGGKKAEVGARLLFDTSTGGNDGAYLMRPGEPFFLPGEREFVGEDVPLYWTAVDDPEQPKAASYGLLYGWGEAKPSRVVFGHWSGLSSTTWDYEIDEWIDYTTDDNIYGTADSAVAIYWDKIDVAPGGAATVATFVGMGDLASRQQVSGNMSVNFTTPKRLLLEDGINTTFEVTAELDNALPDSVDQSNLRIEIGYPNSLRLTGGEGAMTLPLLERNTRLPLKWSFVPSELDPINVYTFTILVKKDETELLRETAHVVALSSFEGELPEIEYTSVSPNRLYYKEIAPRVHITGNNLNYLRDDPDKWSVYVLTKDGTRYDIPSDGVEITTNRSMSVYLPEGLPIGSYGIGIEHELEGRGFYRDNAFEYVNDPRLANRAFGSLLITKVETTVFESITNRQLTHVENKVYYQHGPGTIPVPAGEQEVLRITGNVQKMSDDVYSIIPSTENSIYLGKLLKIAGESVKPGARRPELVIRFEDIPLISPFESIDDPRYEIQRQVFIEGNDLIRIHLETPTLKLGYRVIPEPARKPQIWKGAFRLNVNDFVISNPDLFGLASDTTTNIAGFLLSIKQLRYGYVPDEKQYAVEIKAGLNMSSILSFLYDKFGSKAKYFMYADAQAERFQILEDGTIRFKTEFTVGLPYLKIGPLATAIDGDENQRAGAHGKVSIDTIENVYSIEAKLAIPDLSSYNNVAPGKKTTVGLRGKVGVFLFDTANGVMFMVDTVEAEFYDSYGFIQIPKIPFTINQIGGGIRNLHTLRTATTKYPDFDGYFVFGITDTFSPIILSKRMLSFKDVTLSVGSREIAASGQMYLYFVPLMQAEAKFMYYPKIGAYVSGGINIWDVIVGKATAEVSYNFEHSRFYAGGYVHGYIQIPESSPIFPGAKLAEAMAGISTEEVRAFAAIPIINIYAGVRYRWADRAPEFFTAGEIQLPEMPFSVMTLSDSADPVDQGGMVIGTNLYPIAMHRSVSGGGVELFSTFGGMDVFDAEDTVTSSVYVEPPYFPETVTSSVYSETTYYSDGKDSILIQAKVPRGTEIFPLKLVAPSGKEIEYPVFDEQKVLKSTYRPNENSEPLDYYALVIAAEDNEIGTWRVQTPVDVDWEGFKVLTLSGISKVEAVHQGDLKYEVKIDVDTPPAPELSNVVELYLEKTGDPEANDYFLILASDIKMNADDFPAAIPVELPDTIEDGTYTIRAALRQFDAAGNEMQFQSAVSDPIVVKNPNLPPAPSGVAAKPAGNGDIEVSWDAVAGPDITGYYVTIVDEFGVPVPDAEPVWVSAADGGPDRYAAIIGGYPAGASYNVAVQAVRDTGSADPDDGDIVIPSDYSTLERRGNAGLHLAIWKPVPGVEEYEIIITDGKEEIVIPYFDDGVSNRIETYDDQGELFEGIGLPLKNLSLYIDYDIEVNGIIPENLNAGGVAVTEVSPGTRTISWDAVNAKDIVSYSIVAVPDNPDESDIIVHEYTDVPNPQPGRYSVTLDGFVNGVGYNVLVTANKAPARTTTKFFSPWSAAASVFVPEPSPPDFRISVRAVDQDNQAQTRMMQESGFESFLVNSRNVQIRFDSQDVVRTELYVNSDPLLDAQPYGTYEEPNWSEVVHLEEGMNEIQIAAYNADHDVTLRTYYIAVKTALPTLMADAALSSDELRITGFTDSDTTLYINSSPVTVGEDGSFVYTEPAEGRLKAEFMVTAIDIYGNENTYIGEAVRTDVGAIHGVEIVLERDEMAIAESQKLRLYARDEHGQLTLLPDDAVTWTLFQDEGTEQPSLELSDNGYLTALRPGQGVVMASFQVNENFVWQDAAVVEVDPEREPVAMFHAYLTNVIMNGGAFSPAFDPEVRHYRASVPYSIEEVSFRPQTDLEQLIAIEVNGEPVGNGENSANIPLAVGTNTIEIRVAAHNMFDNLYTFTVIREKSNNVPTPGPGRPDGPSGPIDAPDPAEEPDPEPEKQLAIATVSLPRWKVRQQGSFRIQLNNAGVPPYHFSITDGALPQGLRLDAQSGIISGAPARVGEYSFTVTVQDGDGNSASRSFVLSVTAEPVELSDIADHWAAEAIDKLVSIGAITGFPDGTYRPDNRISRAEFITVLVRALGLTAEGNPQEFADTADHWAREFIAAAASLGIVSGYGDRRFGPDDPITREQIAIMTARAMQLEATSEELAFTDRDDISPWAVKDVAAVVAHGLMRGYPDGTFRPQAIASRAEAAVVIAALLD